MSTRIYALSKQLKVETKTIFDVLKKLGIEGKGSALASLTDEEAEQVKAALQKTAGKLEKPGLPEPLKRPTQKVSGKIPVLGAAGKEKKAKESSQESDEFVEEEQSETTVIETEAEQIAAETTVVEQASDDQVLEDKDSPIAEEKVSTKGEDGTFETVSKEEKTAGPTLPPPIGHIELPPDVRKKPEQKKSPLKGFLKRNQDEDREPEKPKTAPPALPLPITTGFSETGHAAAIRREDYRAPMRSITDKIPNLDSKRTKTEGGKHGGQQKQSGPAVRLAPVPMTPTANRHAASSEPAPMKPDEKLPADVIRNAAAGSTKQIEEHIKKHEERQRKKEEERKVREEKKKGKGVRGSAVLGEEGGGKPGRKGDTLVAAPDEKKKRRGPRRNRSESDDDTVVTPRQLQRRRVRGKAISTAAPRKTDIVIQMPCTVKQFAEQTGLSVAAVIKKSMELGTPVMINSNLDRDTADIIAAEFDLPVDIRDQVSLEDRLVATLFEQEDPPESLKPRPPVVTVLGHVDHGKTTLLDRILKLNVVSGEKGGITQHIRAYRVKMDNGEDITFVDTPGHEAFTEMRARGANCTDIVILVVAADDGIMPQTEEAIFHAKAAGVPIIVAINKIDIPGVNTDRILQDLAARELMPSEWGGDVEIVRCSALTGQGIDELLSTIQIVAELHELKANPDRPALGVALEASLQAGRGVICKVLVQKGTLRPGDVVLCGAAYGRVKVMQDSLNPRLNVAEATPSTPVNLIGLDVAPSAGSLFCVLDDISDARTIAEQRLDEQRKNELADVQSHVTLETLFQRINSAQTIQTLNIIIRADVRGSIEAIRKELGKLDHPEVKIKILQASVGGITEADVMLADASDAIIVGFNVVPDEKARVAAEKKKIQIRRYDIIYNLTDDVKDALEGMLKPMEQVKELGRALVQRVFSISRLGSIAGCRVIAGTIERDSKIRVIRESRIIGEYPLDSLKREKDDVKEIREGYECGMKLKGFNDLKEGDVLEAYKIEEIARTF